jgi:hypothetical protein
LYRGGANTVGKQHFTLLYNRARSLAFTSRNINSGWSKTGLFPFNPDRVLEGIRRAQVKEIVPQTANATIDAALQNDLLHTPVTWESLTCLRTKIEQGPTLDPPSKYRFQKLANATEKAFIDRAILLDEKKLLFEQNNEKTTRLSVRSTVTGNARIMTYDDIIKAQRKRNLKEATTPGTKRGSRRLQNPKSNERKRSRVEELEHGRREIKALGLEEYCSVLQF